MEQLQYMIPCLLGLERLVADELLRLGMKDVRAENGRVFCQGTIRQPALRSCFRAPLPSTGRS